MSSISFEYPYLLLLFPLFLLCFKLCPQKEDALLFSNTKQLSKSSKRVSFLDIFKILAILFSILALASPYSVKHYQKSQKNSLSISLVVDASLSMKEDFKQVKKQLKEFISKRDGDILSLIFFADTTSISASATYDKEFINSTLSLVKAGDLGEYETHLYDAIYLATKLTKNKDVNNSIIIVLTDGADKGSKTSIQTLSDKLSSEKVPKIFAIGYKESVDKKVLKYLSNLTGGEYIDAKDIYELKERLNDIDKKYKKEDNKREFTKKEPLYQLPLFFAFMFLLFYTYLLNKRAVL